MEKLFFLSCLLFLGVIASTQTLTQKLQKAYQQFETDAQLKYAISSLYVIDAATGLVVFGKNTQVGLAPASTQKIITAATAFELFGKDYRYKTEIRGISNRSYIVGYGDPSLGSPRFDKNGYSFFAEIIAGLKDNRGGLGRISAADPWFEKLSPDGWIYQDLGNYYGATAYGLNWNENQVDITFIPGKPGDHAVIDTTITPAWFWKGTRNQVKTGPAGSGDNAYIYLLGYHHWSFFIKGTVPAGVKRFTISGANPSSDCTMIWDLFNYCDSNNIPYSSQDGGCFTIEDSVTIKHGNILYTHYSPSLDSLVYWFLQKSINLYGEAFIKTFAYEKNGYGTTDGGISIVKDFWKQKGIDENELNIFDGSGLSPQNRVTTHAQVEILKYAKKKSWFSYFYNALPEYNGMKMKSGTIKNVKGYCGYHKAKNGKEYIFSFLVNNYNGSSSSLVTKMYKVLDVLK